MEKSIGTFNVKFTRNNLSNKIRMVITIISFIVYVLLTMVIGINILLAMLVSLVCAIGLKRWFKYKQAKKYRKDISH